MNKVFKKLLNFMSYIFILCACYEVFTENKEELLISMSFASLLQISSMNLKEDK